MQPGGCQIVAGDRSEAKTTGWAAQDDRTPTGCQIRRRARFAFIFSHPFGVQIFYDWFRWFCFASTTGYYLPALRAEAPSKLSDCRKFKLESTNDKWKMYLGPSDDYYLPDVARVRRRSISELLEISGFSMKLSSLIM